MIPQREASEPIYEQASPTYGGYEGGQEYAHQHREGLGGKVYPELRDTRICCVSYGSWLQWWRFSRLLSSAWFWAEAQQDGLVSSLLVLPSWS